MKQVLKKASFFSQKSMIIFLKRLPVIRQGGYPGIEKIKNKRMKNLHLLGLSIILILIISACNRFSEYPGFTKTRSGIYYQLLSIGEDKERAKVNDFVTADITYKTMSDSVFFTGRRKLQITEPEYEGAIDECFTFLAKDESACFIISADDFFSYTLETILPGFLPKGSKMKIVLDILDIQKADDYYKEKEAFLSWIEDFGDYEKVILKQFIGDKKLSVEATESGLYFIPIKTGTGKQVEKGDTIVVHYEGRFLNGKFFDSTVKRNEPFQFVYGQQWQVIKGIEEAIGLMHEGEKALVILPSELGFGKGGSSGGTIPPFTSLIFEVEVLSINKEFIIEDEKE